MNISETEIFFLIVAAGAGRRMGTHKKKQYLKIEGTPILSLTLSVFQNYPEESRIILVVPEEDISYCREKILRPLKMADTVSVVAGGRERHHSVGRGLDKVRMTAHSPEQCIVVIHDGVRPFIDKKIIGDCIAGAESAGACISAVESVDSLKRVGEDKVIKATLDRKNVYQAQTPQAFKLNIILHAFQQAAHTGFSGTDDSSVVENSGHDVLIVKGSKRNIKITTREDVRIAEALLAL